MSSPEGNGELKRSFDVSRLETNYPKVLRVEASPEECGAIAERLGILSVGAVAAKLQILADGSGDVKVYGTLAGEVEQACVVTLEPVSEAVETRVAQRFSRRIGEEEGEEEDPLEPIVDDQIELGEILVQNFALALDPYPRAPGATFEPVGDEEPGASGPFAALAQLRDTPDKSGE